MLHRSFKPAKCKTSLKLATSRIKLMKNKKGVQINQMKRELAQLLESGQDQTARIRVEHVIREEKMVAAYDLVEIYCELIAARLPIIESQKNCPIDLKEAITSVIFASPRCADIPELLDVRKHFTAKYGKEFITAAVELRPECGVSRMLVEKLSANAPDGPTKVKVLTAIAEEHNIKWEPKSFGEKDSKHAEDLLNGPNTFEKASKMHAEPSTVQDPNFQAPSSHANPDRPLNFSEQNSRSSLDTQNFPTTDTGGIKSTPATSHSDFRPFGKETDRMEVRHSYEGEGNTFYSGRQNWNMEFKDATAAAQAAAESAERASMAARAAAELSSRENITRQYSTESHMANNPNIRHERPGNYVTSELPGEHISRVPVENSFHNRNPNVLNEQINRNVNEGTKGGGERYYQDGYSETKRSSRSASLQSSRASVDQDTFEDSVQKTDEYSEKSSFEAPVKTEKGPLSYETRMKKQSINSRAESQSGWQDELQSENFDYFAEAKIRKQYSTDSLRSHSGSFSGDYNVPNHSHQKFGNDAAKDPFVVTDKGSNTGETIKRSSYDDDAVISNKYEFDGESNRYDVGPKYDEGESTPYIPSLGRNSTTFPSTAADTWSPRTNRNKSLEKSVLNPHFSAESPSSPLFTESFAKSAVPSQSDNFVAVASYDSDGPKFDSPKFDSEDELEKSSVSSLSYKQNVFSLDPVPTQDGNHEIIGPSFKGKAKPSSDRRSSSGSSSDDLDSVEVRLKNKPVKVYADSPKKLNSEESFTSRPSPRFEKSRSEFNDPEDEDTIRQSSRLSLAHGVEDTIRIPDSPDSMQNNELFNQSSQDSGSELNFGTLTGGFRNKGYRHPPYARNSAGNASSLSKKAATETSPSLRNSSNSSASNNEDKKPSFSTSIARSDSDTDESEDEYPQQPSIRRQDPYIQKPRKEVNVKSSFKPPVATYFDQDIDDSKEDVPKQTLSNRSQLGSVFSRRTKPSYSSSETSSFSKVRVESEALSVSSNSGIERKPTRSSNVAETPTKIQYKTANQGQSGSDESPSSVNATPPKAMPEPKVSLHKESFKSSAAKQPSSPRRNSGASGNVESAKTSTVSAESSSTGENATKRASHVHPKLPDFDSITAHLDSIRKNRQ